MVGRHALQVYDVVIGLQALMLYLVGSAEGPPAASPLLPPAVPLPLDALLSAAGLLSLVQRALPQFHSVRLLKHKVEGNNHSKWAARDVTPVAASDCVWSFKAGKVRSIRSGAVKHTMLLRKRVSTMLSVALDSLGPQASETSRSRASSSCCWTPTASCGCCCASTSPAPTRALVRPQTMLAHWDSSSSALTTMYLP